MALRKEPGRRYASADQFAEDIRRHLAGLPVIARRDTFSYRTEKFIRRHRVGVAAVMVVVLALVAGGFATAWQARRAREQMLRAEAERARAQRRFDDVRRLANSLTFELHDAIEKLPGATPVREMLVKRALEHLDGLAREASDGPSLLHDLASSYLQIGELQGRPKVANLGDTAAALASYDKALAIWEKLLSINPSALEAKRGLASCYDRIGEMRQTKTADLTGALASFRRALLIRAEVAKADSQNLRAGPNLVAVSHLKIGDALVDAGDLTGAIASYSQALTIRETLLAIEPDNPHLRRDLLDSYVKIGNVQKDDGDVDAALGSYREALAALEITPESVLPNEVRRLKLADVRMRIGHTLMQSEDERGALAHYRTALEIYEAASSAEPTDTILQKSLADAHTYIAGAVSSFGNGGTRVSTDHCRRAVVILENLAKADPANEGIRLQLSRQHVTVATILQSVERTGEASAHLRRATEISENTLAKDPTNSAARREVARTYIATARLFILLKDFGAAIEVLRKSLSMFEEMSSADPVNSHYRNGVGGSCFYLGAAYTKLAASAKAPPRERIKMWEQARVWYQRSSDVWLTMRSQNMLIGSHAELVDNAAAGVTQCDTAIAGLRRAARTNR